MVAPATAVAGAATTTPSNPAGDNSGVSNPLPPQLAERLRALRDRPVEPTEKGFGPLATGGPGVTAASLAAARPALHAAGFSYPLLTLRETALAGNIEAMAAYCDRAGVALAPHGKTAMSPELAARQLARGAWGITVATIGQLQTYRAFGFPRLLLANELVDEAGIAWLAAELAADPGFAAYCYVDSAEGVAILDRVLTRPAGRPQASRPGGDRPRPRAHRLPDRRPRARRGQGGGRDRHAPGGGRGRVRGFERMGRRQGGGRGRDTALGLIASFCRRLRGLAEVLAAGPRPATAARSSSSRPAAARTSTWSPGS